jgi:hypothetical protein
MADSSITTITVEEIGDLAGRLAREGRSGCTAIDGQDWQEVKRDCLLVARVLRHLVVTGIIYTALELEGC